MTTLYRSGVICINSDFQTVYVRRTTRHIKGSPRVSGKLVRRGETIASFRGGEAEPGIHAAPGVCREGGFETVFVYAWIPDKPFGLSGMTGEQRAVFITLAINEASKKWTVPILNWKSALNRFMIEFEDRLVNSV